MFGAGVVVVIDGTVDAFEVNVDVNAGVVLFRM